MKNSSAGGGTGLVISLVIMIFLFVIWRKMEERARERR